MHRIDHKSYPAYKDTAGSYQFRGYILSIDHVQGDPFASPSDVSIHVPAKMAGFPEKYYDRPYRRIALQDLLTRTFARKPENFPSRQRLRKERSHLREPLRPGDSRAQRLSDSAGGRRGVPFPCGLSRQRQNHQRRELEKILFDYLPQCAQHALFYKSYNEKRVLDVIRLADDQDYIRQQLKERNLAAFVADGAILPRESGVSAKPMKGAIPFASPDSLAVTLDLPNAGPLRGMGIPRGITMIAGGGYHGKSTLLKALELGVYNHIAGDGREYVITDDTAGKTPGGGRPKHYRGGYLHVYPQSAKRRDTACFSTEDASGSTSQAANVVEAMEMGSKVFLIDEDTSATNFMIRTS